MRDIKKVLLIGPFPPPVGGNTVSTSNLLRSRYWTDEGYTIEPLNTSAGDRVRLPGERLSARDLLRGVKIVFKAILKMRNVRIVLLWANARFIYSAAPPIIVLCRMLGKKVVMKPFGALLVDRIGRAGLVRRLLLRISFSGAHMILPQTDRLAEVIAESGVDHHKIRIFPNFLTDEEIRQVQKLQNGDHRGKVFEGRCVFAGQIKREKGVFEIIEALCESAYTCEFYGQIAPRDEKEFFERISGHGNLEYRGILDPAEVAGVISRYDALLFPSSHPGEGLPAVILQAFMTGIPVIASEWKSIPLLLGGGERGLLVPTGSPKALIEAIDRLGSDPDLRGRLTVCAREFVAGFSESAVVRDLLIRDVISKGIG